MADNTSPTLVCRTRSPIAVTRPLTVSEWLIADTILDSNLNLPLKGIAIGNGWIDAYTQYPSYLEYAVKHGILSESEDASRTLFSQVFRSYHETTSL